VGETAISWTARRRTTPTDAACLHPDVGPCLDIECPRCWSKGFTVNPWLGCVEKNAACTNCYARTTAEHRMGLDVWGKNRPREIRVGKAIRELLRINTRARRTGQRVGAFSGSMCDVFEDRADLDEPRTEYLDAAQYRDDIDLMLLTKRPENIAGMVPWTSGWPRHIWIGATIASPGDEDMAGHLAVCKARGAITFASIEPMLWEGPTPGEWLRAIDVCIIGGESGGGARPFDVEAARRLVSACDAYGSRVWFKQMGSRWAQANGGGLRKGASHGQDPYRWPAWARRRELPAAR
jgi:protein gp37